MSRLVGPAVSDSKIMWRSLLNSTEASTIFLQFTHDCASDKAQSRVEGKINDWHYCIDYDDYLADDNGYDEEDDDKGNDDVKQRRWWWCHVFFQ